jgi:hypothetical protein
MDAAKLRHKRRTGAGGDKRNEVNKMPSIRIPEPGVVRYREPHNPSMCALCGQDAGVVYFKEKPVCSDCLALVRAFAH